MQIEQEIEIDKFLKRRRTRIYLFLFFSIVSLVTGVLFISMPLFIGDLLLFGERVSIIFGAILSITGTGLLLSVYLNSKPLYRSGRYFDYDYIDINTYFNQNLKKNLINKYGSGFRGHYADKDDEKPEMFEIEIELHKSKFVEQSLHDLEYANLFDELYKLDGKIKSQIERLENNSNLNLIIGIITSSIAIIFLGISIFNGENFTSSFDLISHYIPRISTVIFVEIFSFFFLKLYKNNLAEIKYFQNEITNLNFKIASLKTAIKTKDTVTISEIVKNFSVTERNFILKKNESTEKIEIQKMDSQNKESYFQTLTKLIASIKK